MKKILFVCSALLMIGFSAKAQVQFGLRAGGNMSSLLAKEEGDYERLKFLPGFHVGGTADIALGNSFALQPGLIFSTKGYKVDEDAVSFDLYNDQTVKLSAYYLELPVNVIFKPQLGKGNLLLGVGPYIAYGLGGKWKATSDGISVKGDLEFVNDFVDTNTNTDSSAFNNSPTLPYGKPFDFGGNLLIGYQFTKNCYIQLNGQLGLLDIEPSYNGISDERTSMKNVQFGLSVGYKF